MEPGIRSDARVQDVRAPATQPDVDHVGAIGRVQRLRVLFIVDSLYWAIGHFAKTVQSESPWADAVICSHYAFQQHVRKWGTFPCDFDIVHFLTAKVVGDFCGRVPTVTTLHHVDSRTDMDSLWHSDMVMTVSTQWRDDLATRGFSRERVGLVPFGVDTQRFVPLSDEERACRKRPHRIDPETFVVGFAARQTSDTDGRKGTDCLLNGLMALRRCRRDFVVLLIGPGWQAFGRRLRAHGIARVHAPYYVDHGDIAPYYGILDAYWVTSRIEGGPVSLLEAMACGVPCLSTPVGQARDMIMDGVNGYLLPFDQPRRFAARTMELWGDRERCRTIGAKARAGVLENRRWTHTDQRLQELYRRTIANFTAAQSATPYHASDRTALVHSFMPTSGRDDRPRRFSPDVTRWMHACESVRGLRMMLQVGAWRQAMKQMSSAMRAAPWNADILRQILRVSARELWKRYFSSKRAPPFIRQSPVWVRGRRAQGH